jgi:hypothetical protein
VARTPLAISPAPSGLPLDRCKSLLLRRVRASCLGDVIGLPVLRPLDAKWMLCETRGRPHVLENWFGPKLVTNRRRWSRSHPAGG